jgi:hypothetical protein
MATERVPCQAEGCNNKILPETAKANGGYCVPCVIKRRNQERQEYIRQNRREVDLYAGITDAVEMIRIMHTRRAHDPLIIFRPCQKSQEELYSGLNLDQATCLIKLAASEMRVGNKDFAEDIAKSLATLTAYQLDLMLEAWIEQKRFWPAVIFRGAGPRIRDVIVSVLESGKANANHALSALAWIGDTCVQDLFSQWESKLPRWCAGLHVGPAGYAHVAGWELNANKRRNLFHDECWAIAPAPAVDVSGESLRLMHEVAQDCPWCQRKLVHLVELDLGDERFAFLGFLGETLPVLTCDACTCYGLGFVFARIEADGTARLADENLRPSWMPDDLSSWGRSPWKDIPVRLHHRSAIHATDWCMPVSLSQIGGLPSWVQDSAFPKCPDCLETMMFIAQVDNGQFPSNEGVYYAFLCAACRVTATTYQQT